MNEIYIFYKIYIKELLLAQPQRSFAPHGANASYSNSFIGVYKTSLEKLLIRSKLEIHTFHSLLNWTCSKFDKVK